MELIRNDGIATASSLYLVLDFMAVTNEP